MRRFFTYACISAVLGMLPVAPAALAQAAAAAPVAAAPTVPTAAPAAAAQPVTDAAAQPAATAQPDNMAQPAAAAQPAAESQQDVASDARTGAAGGEVTQVRDPGILGGAALEPVYGVVAEPVADFPSRPVRIVVPYAAGSSTDVMARALVDKVGAELGQKVVVENKPGAGSNIAANHVAKSDPDGYTVFLGTSTALAVNESLFKNLAFAPYREFTPVVLAAMIPSVFVVPEKSEIKTLQELTASLKKDDSSEYASAGNGTPSHMGAELYKRIIDGKAAQKLYKGSLTALGELVDEEADFMIAIIPDAMPLVREGKLRALAVSTAQRLPAYPNLPTAAESGVPDFDLLGWYGIVAPIATPPLVVEKLTAAFNAALNDPAIREQLTSLGFEVQGGPASRLSDLMRADWARWKRFILEAHVVAE